MDRDREGALHALRSLRDRLKEAGVMHLVLFGSMARGDHRASSDLDVAFELEPARSNRFSLIDHAGLQILLEPTLGVPVDAVNLRNVKGTSLERAIRNEGIQVF